jgi:type VI secretion system secreted protein Hcp
MLKDKRTARVGTLVVALSLSLLTFLAPGKALAVYDCCLFISAEKQGAIDGDSNIKGREHSIEVISYSFGETLQISTTTTGQYTGSVVMQDFKVTMKTGRASPKLFQAALTRERIKEAKLKIYTINAKGQPEHSFSITLNGVIISSFLNLGNSKSSEARPIEEVMFKLISGSKIRFTYEIDGVEFQYQIGQQMTK